MNRRSFLKWTGAAAAIAMNPLSALAGKTPVIPHIQILQTFNPLITKVAGAKAGMLAISSKKLFNSIEFVPCHTQHLYFEWRNRGKLVGTHAWDSKVVKAAKAASTQFPRCTTPSGNDLIETFYLYGLMVQGDKVVTPCVLAFSGAKIKAYKNLMKVVHLTPSIDGQLVKVKPPLLAYRLRISTVLEQNKSGRFYNYRIGPAKGDWEICWDSMSVDVTDTLLPPDHPLLRAAQEFRKQVTC